MPDSLSRCNFKSKINVYFIHQQQLYIRFSIIVSATLIPDCVTGIYLHPLYALLAKIIESTRQSVQALKKARDFCRYTCYDMYFILHYKVWSAATDCPLNRYISHQILMWTAVLHKLMCSVKTSRIAHWCVIQLEGKNCGLWDIRKLWIPGK